jgi:hypothetical protein
VKLDQSSYGLLSTAQLHQSHLAVFREKLECLHQPKKALLSNTERLRIAQ